VLTAALKAARRVNDFPTAVRIFEGTYMDSDSIPYVEYRDEDFEIVMMEHGKM